jgi:hypothetical protein
MDRHEPIDRICRLIDGLPENAWGRCAMRHFVCGALGMRPDLTGLPVTPQRKLRELYWDYETDNLRCRLVQLVNEQGIDPEFLLLGVCGFIRALLEGVIDPEQVDRHDRQNQEMIEKLTRTKELPADEREQRLSDEEIDSLIEIIRKTRDSAPANAEAARHTKDMLEELVNDLFSDEFWREYRASQVSSWRELLPPEPPESSGLS